MNNLNKKFCGRPWEFLEIHDDGGLKIYNCCPNWVNHNDLGKMSYDANFESIWNGEKSIEFRKSILDGSFKYCNKTECPMIQNNSLPEKEDILNNYHGEYYKKILEENILIAENANFINFCYDVSCNLKCPSCRPTFWFLNEKINPIDYNIKKQFQEKLLEYLYKCTRPITINITGSGDPFASKLFWEFLTSIDGKLNKNIRIHLQTNGVLFTEENWKKLEKIHQNEIGAIISIDAGTKDTYSYTRRGGDWDKLMRNLQFIDELYQNSHLTFVRLDCVVQNKNYKEIPLFIEIAKKHNFQCYLSRIVNWGRGTYTEEEFKEHNIFDIKHHNHSDFIKVINQNFDYEKIDFGNLSEYRNI
jgi:sulfatase maturation enzyme AslB (radical SAM superfamily)